MAGETEHVRRLQPGRRPVRRGRAFPAEAPGEVEADRVREAYLKGTGAGPKNLARVLPETDPAARASIVRYLQQQRGNTYVQKVLARLPDSRSGTQMPGAVVQRQPTGQGKPSARPTSPLVPDIAARLEPNLAQNLRQNPARRDLLLVLYARVGPFWQHVRQITWVGDHGEMEFYPVDDGALVAALASAGYTTSYFAKRGNNRWGLREPNVSSAGLHWRGLAGGKVNAHIDLHPPSWTGLWHLIQDDWRRGKTHTPDTLRAGVESLGTYIPVLYEQKVHGELTVRLNALEGQARTHPDALAALNRGRQHLSDAGQIIWTRDVVSQADLAAALFSLYEAGREAYWAEQVLRGIEEMPPAHETGARRGAMGATGG